MLWTTVALPIIQRQSTNRRLISLTFEDNTKNKTYKKIIKKNLYISFAQNFTKFVKF